MRVRACVQRACGVRLRGVPAGRARCVGARVSACEGSLSLSFVRARSLVAALYKM